MIKLVAFDWNGTILSDTNAVLKADNAILKHFGLPQTNLRELQNLFRIPIRDYWIAMGIDVNLFDKNAKTIASMFMEHYEPLEKVSRTRSGVREILGWLKKNHITSIIFSNHVVEHIENQMKRLKIDTLVSKILARSLGDISHLHGKSKDIKLSEYVKKAKIKHAEVLTVGDSDEEIEIAKKYGYYSVALTGGNMSQLRLKAAEPDFLIHNLVDLKRIVKNL